MKLDKNSPILIAGGGGFIGGHLVKMFLDQGYTHVRSVDVKPIEKWYQVFDACDNQVRDLRDPVQCQQACQGIKYIYNLAADMGGMGFIENNKALCMLSVLINTHLLMAARDQGATRFFYSSSACVYNTEKLLSPEVIPLKESDAYPALPEDGYGWEKLFSERMCRHFQEDFGLITRVARFDNIYGPHGSWNDGREKAPAAICRKVIQAVDSGNHSIEIWGDGKQTRCFMYIDDCLQGIEKIMDSDIDEPINLGSDELVTINELVSIVENIAGVKLKRNYHLDAPKGVIGRISDYTMIQQRLGWQPSIRLSEGMKKTYQWIFEEYKNSNSTVSTGQ